MSKRNNTQSDAKNEYKSQQLSKDRGRWRERCNYRRSNNSNVECYNYHKYGHYAWECHGSSDKKEGHVNIIHDKQDEGGNERVARM